MRPQTGARNAAFSQSCLLCGAALRVQQAMSRILGLPFDRPQRVYECVHCGYRMLSPYFTEEEIRALYGDHYFTGETDARAHGATGFAVDYEVFAADRMPKFAATLDSILRHAPGARSILDVGAATGDFLNLARQRGLEPAGVELSAHAATIAKDRHNLDLFVGRLEDFQTARQFDAIHLNHVLEHFPDPKAIVRILARLLSRDGVIYVEVPFQFNIAERAKFQLTRSSAPFTISSIHHSTFFTPSTLAALFAPVQMRAVHLRVFDRSRYPARTPLQRAKRLAWEMLSWLDQGVFIEAIFAFYEGKNDDKTNSHRTQNAVK